MTFGIGISIEMGICLAIFSGLVFVLVRWFARDYYLWFPKVVSEGHLLGERRVQRWFQPTRSGMRYVSDPPPEIEHRLEFADGWVSLKPLYRLLCNIWGGAASAGVLVLMYRVARIPGQGYLAVAISVAGSLLIFFVLTNRFLYVRRHMRRS